MNKSEAGQVGFYRAYSPGVFDTLEEACEWVLLLAQDWGLVEVQVNKRASTRYSTGGFFVAVVGRRPEGVQLGSEHPFLLPPETRCP